MFFNRGTLHGRLGNLDLALADFTAAIDARSDLGEAYLNRGKVYQLQRRFSESLEDYERAAEFLPNVAEPFNLLASLLATCPEPSLRDGSRAVVAAKKACELTEMSDHRYLQTLATAFAALGNYSAAATWQSKAVVAAPTNAKPAARRQLQEYCK